MLRKATLFALPFAMLILGWSAISAQELTASEREGRSIELYSKGVHAYFDGNYSEALESLNGAIKLETTDPRAYYFRGLTHFEMGDIDKAKQDFVTAAEMEIAGLPQFYPVNRSLERIQGESRLLLEEMRAFAREETERKKAAYRAARYERLRRAEDLVLRKPLDEIPQLPDVDLSKIPNLPFKNVGEAGNN